MSSTPASSEPKVNPSNGPPNTTTTSPDVATTSNTNASADDGANVGASSTTSEDGAVDSTVSENDAATTANANEDQQSNQNSEQQNNEGDENQAQQQQHDQQQQQHHQQQMEMGHPHPHMQGGMMPYGMVNGDMEQYDQETLMALSNQMMLHPHRGDHDGMNGGVVNPPPMMPGMNGNVEICRAYLAGRCSRGGACRFVHVENGSGHQPPNPHLCRDWLNGTCIRGTNCRFQHQGVSGSKASIHNGVSKPGNWAGPGGKIIICHQWASRGRCDYGTACKFAHHQRMGGDRWNESALDEKKLLAAMLSGLTPQEALSQALNSIQNNNPQKFGGPVPPANPQGAVDPNSPSQQAGGPQDPQVFNAMAAMGAGPQLVPPQKRADGSLILCRFFARHGFCKYGVACKFHHQPIVPGQGGMFPPSPYVRDPAMMGGAPNQSLASLLALGLKASMMSNDHLIANHAALLAASMNQPGVPPRMNSPGPMGGQPIDPQLANVLAAYLQQQQHPSHNANIAALLQQLQGGGAAAGGPPGNGSISPTQLQGFDAFTGGAHSQGQDVAFQAFLQQQHHQQVAQQNAFQNAFSPAAASAFNAIPNLNTPTQAASGPNAPQPNGLSLPQMISTAFRSNNTNGAPASSTANGGSSLSNNLSLMSLKPFSDDGGSPSSFEPASGTNTVSGSSSGSTGHARSNSSSFDASGSSLLGGDQRNSYEFGQTSSTSATNNSQIIGPSSLNNGSPNSSSLSALFSSSLNGPFLH